LAELNKRRKVKMTREKVSMNILFRANVKTEEDNAEARSDENEQA
jgi:hypothetical protein